MPGTYIFKPIEANITHNTDIIGKMNPYCAFLAGTFRVKGEVCKKGGKHPMWNDTITIPQYDEPSIAVQLMDKDKLSTDDNIGTFVIDLQEVQSQGQVTKWYPLLYKEKPAGEILLESVFQPGTGISQARSYPGEAVGMGSAYEAEQLGFQSQQLGATSGFQGEQSGVSSGYQGEQLGVSSGYQGEKLGTASFSGPGTGSTYTEQAGMSQGGFVSQQGVTRTEDPIIQGPTSIEQGLTLSQENRKMYIEQRQMVEPHVFTKAVDVVETRPLLKEIEVLEPVKVLKDVQYTEAVPVIKEIEVTEPKVVKKEIEVIEPRVVTKVIHVVENVPVMKEVEVIEPVTYVKAVETFEPQTFTKQVEVIEQVPVMKQVTVTEPVTVTKAVDFVEPIITTKTITKEIKQPVVVDEKITTTVGPAYVAGIKTEFSQQRLAGQFSEMNISEEQRLGEKERLFEQEQWRLEQERLQGNQAGYSSTQNLGNQNLGLEDKRLNASNPEYTNI